MKNLSLYKTEDTLTFDFTKVEENLHAPLTSLQSEKIGFVELFEGTYYTTNVEGYTIFKVAITKRKEPKQETVENEFTYRLAQNEKKGITVDLDMLLEEVNIDLNRTAEQTHKEVLVVFDHINKRFMIDAPRPIAEDAMSLLHVLYEGATFEVIKTDPLYMQQLMTKYVVDEDTIPEPFCLAEYTELAEKVKVGAEKAKPSTILVKKEYSSCDEVQKHIACGKLVNKLELDYSGVLYFKVDTTFFINSVSFDQELKYSENEELTKEDNLTAHWLVALPEVSKAVNILLADLIKLNED